MTAGRTRQVTLRVTVRVTPGVTRTYWKHRDCAWRDYQFGRGENTALGWSDPVFWPSGVAKNTRGVAPAQQDRRAKDEVNGVKEVRIASCNSVFTRFFTTKSLYLIHPQRLSRRIPRMLTIACRDGSTKAHLSQGQRLPDLALRPTHQNLRTTIENRLERNICEWRIFPAGTEIETCTAASNSVCVRTQRPNDDMAHASE